MVGGVGSGCCRALIVRSGWLSTGYDDDDERSRGRKDAQLGSAKSNSPSPMVITITIQPPGRAPEKKDH